MSTSSLRVGTPSDSDQSRFCACFHSICELTHFTSNLLRLEDLISLVFLIPSGHYHLSVSNSTGFPESQEERIDGAIPFIVECSRVSHSLHCMVVGLFICSHVLNEKAFLIMA